MKLRIGIEMDNIADWQVNISLQGDLELVDC